ncbi:SAM-dependent chlorinase/fluorinase [Candidatus Amesbacteria bacterium]|nr:SAM-dependent chlorinase/fluorinase [Candidatus Amesbacteria bacterium]
MNNIITITTDFGDQFATSQLKAVIYSLNFTGQLIENHDIAPFSVIEGAYGIWQLSKYCPTDTIHVGIVDPGVGGTRAGIIIKTKNFWFVGPDNGLFWETANRDRIKNIWQIDESYFGQISNTFHGRDVFVKSAVFLAQGLLPESFGCTEISKIEQLEFKPNQVVHIDHYGNIKYWGNNAFDLPVVNTFSDVEPNQPLILNGSSDLLELAVNLGSAKDKFGLQLGQIIKSL